MKNTTVMIGVLLFTATIVPATVAAQDQPSQTTVDGGLRSLENQTGEIIRLLRELIAQRAEDHQLKRLQVAILALQLRSTSISDIETRIRTLEDRVAAAKEDVANLETNLQHYDQIALDDSTSEQEQTQLEFAKNQVKHRIGLATQRVYSLESQVLDLQNDLIQKRRNVDALEEIVMDGLNNL